MLQELIIDHIGHRGDGVAAGPRFIPYTLPGERVRAEIAGERGRLIEVLERSSHRIEPFCGLFTQCGGCAIQHWDEAGYRAWKRDLVVTALRNAGIEGEVAPLRDAHGEGRRRATLHARRGLVGFAEARSHALVDLEACPILTPALNLALPMARALEKTLRVADKPLDILITATLSGLDCDVRGSGKVAERTRLALSALAGEFDLARLALHGDVVLERRAPRLTFGAGEVMPPAGSFLQATAAADQVLAELVIERVGKARRIADLFCGCGTLSLPLASHGHVNAYDSDKAAVAALNRGARAAKGVKPLNAEARDLYHRPLLPVELKAFDAVVFDPPRAGAPGQAQRLAASAVRRIVAVSCNPATFAADAAVLIAGGYRMGEVVPVDQFRHSAHVELVAAFER